MSSMRLDSMRWCGALLLTVCACGNAKEDQTETGGTTAAETTAADTSTSAVDSSTSTTTTTGPTDSATTVPEPVCGNGVLEPPEQCDDGNTDPGDGCEPDCTEAIDTQQWSDTIGGAGGVQESGQGIAVDSADNVIVVGYIVDVVGDPNVWVRKYAPDGTELWTQTYDPSMGMDDRGYGVAVDSADNIIVVGDTAVNAAVSDIWIAKLDPDGNETWSTTIDGPESGADVGEDVAVDSADNIVVTGYVRAAPSDNDIWFGKFSPGGMQMWTGTIAGPDGLDDRGTGIGVAAADDVVVAGFISNEGFDRDVWLGRYDADGNEVWTSGYASLNDGSESAFDLTVAPDDTVGVAGTTPIVADNDDVWLGRFDPDGELHYQKKFGGPAILNDHGLGVAADSMVSFVVVGFKGVTPQDTDIWLRKWDDIGNVVWTQNVAGAGQNRDQALDVAIDSQDNVVVTGEIRPADNNDGEIWVAKFGPG